jgi:hypothetical protein
MISVRNAVPPNIAANLSRREMLKLSGLGFGSLALNCLLQSEPARSSGLWQLPAGSTREPA